jgi:hypothetical protein
VAEIVSTTNEARLSRQWLPETAVFYLPNELFHNQAAARVFVIIGEHPGAHYTPEFFIRAAPNRKILNVQRVAHWKPEDWGLWELTLQPR